VAELVAGAPSRALAVYAHPDDADVSCGATLAAWAEQGCEVHVVVCTLGEKGSPDPAADAGELARRRRAEVAAASALLGVAEVHPLGHRDGEIDNDLALRFELVSLIRRLRPDALVCPDPTAVFFGEHYYSHRDHRVVGFAALDAAAPAAAAPLYFPEAGPPHPVEVAYLSGSLEPNAYVDVSSTIRRKVEAVLRHESQLEGSGRLLAEAIEERASAAGRVAGVAFAEAFRRLYLGR